jgi:hypothetical protein
MNFAVAFANLKDVGNAREGAFPGVAGYIGPFDRAEGVVN